MTSSSKDRRLKLGRKDEHAVRTEVLQGLSLACSVGGVVRSLFAERDP